MNPRRVHELMRSHFPPFETNNCEWLVAVDEAGVRMPFVENLLNEYIPGEMLLIEVNRRLGDCLERVDACRYIAEYGARGLRISNRSFTGFVVIAPNGVATGWKTEMSLSERGVSQVG